MKAAWTNRNFAIGLIIAVAVHVAVACWGMTLQPAPHSLVLEIKKPVKTVRQEIVLPKKVPPKVEPQPEIVKPQPTETPQEAPHPVDKPAQKPKSEAPKPQQKPSEPAPLVLSKTYGASDGSGVAVNAGKNDTLGDPNVDPTAQNTRQRFVPKAEQASTGDDKGDQPGDRKVEITHATQKFCRPEWPEGAEAGGRKVEVMLLLDVNEEGKVGKVRLIRGAGEPFDEAAMAQIQSPKICSFSPGMRDGKAIPDRIRFTIEFLPRR